MSWFGFTRVSANLSGLTCGTTYHYRLDENDSDFGAFQDIDQCFTTSACAAPVPTLSEWGTIILAGAMALVMAFALRRRGATAA